MTKDHRRLDAQLVQEVLLDDPDILREIVERVFQEVLEAEMTEHVGAAPHQRTDAARAIETVTNRERFVLGWAH